MSYSVSDIQGCFKYIVKTHEAVADNPRIRIHVNKIENRIKYRIKTGYDLESVTPEMMKLFGSTKSKKNEDENGEYVPHLKITEVV